MTFRDYAQYALTDFLEDDSFVQWVIEPSTKTSSFWESFIASHPEKEALIHQAASIIRVYRKQSAFTNEERREQVWKRIDASIQNHHVTASRKIHRIPLYLKIAASIALLVSCAAAVWI